MGLRVFLSKPRVVGIQWQVWGIGGMSSNAILKWSPRDPLGKWETRIRTMWGGRWSQGDLRGHISETVMGSACSQRREGRSQTPLASLVAGFEQSGS